MEQQLTKRSRFHYAGTYLEKTTQIKSTNFENILSKYLSKANFYGEYTVVITKICPCPDRASGLEITGCTRFGVDMIYIEEAVGYAFYLELGPLSNPASVISMLQAAGLKIGSVPAGKTYEPIGRVPNRVYKSKIQN